MYAAVLHECMYYHSHRNVSELLNRQTQSSQLLSLSPRACVLPREFDVTHDAPGQLTREVTTLSQVRLGAISCI